MHHNDTFDDLTRKLLAVLSDQKAKKQIALWAPLQSLVIGGTRWVASLGQQHLVRVLQTRKRKE
jgi:hypothetical protein